MQWVRVVRAIDYFKGYATLGEEVKTSPGYYNAAQHFPESQCDTCDICGGLLTTEDDMKTFPNANHSIILCLSGSEVYHIDCMWLYRRFVVETSNIERMLETIVGCPHLVFSEGDLSLPVAYATCHLVPGTENHVLNCNVKTRNNQIHLSWAFSDSVRRANIERKVLVHAIGDYGFRPKELVAMLESRSVMMLTVPCQPPKSAKSLSQ
jgi:hypothetical protein